MTTHRGYRFATSVGGTLTGRGGNLIIVDDPIKPDEAVSETKRKRVNEWFDRTLYSRLDDKSNDVIVIVMQRVHVEDLAGHVLEKESWVHLDLPAIAETAQVIQIGEARTHHRKPGDLLHPERESAEVLDEIKRSIGSFNFSAQYQQCPVPPDGEVVKWAWFQFYDGELPRAAGDRIVQSWDTASKAEEFSDYSVGTTWLVHGNEYYLLDVVREKLIYPDLKRRIIEHAFRANAQTILIEDKGSGTSLIQDIGRERVKALPKPTAYRPKLDKITRMHAQSARIEAGHVYLPRRAPWLDAFRLEFLQFPHGRHDDQVDSVSQFLDWAENRTLRTAHMVKLEGW